MYVCIIKYPADNQDKFLLVLNSNDTIAGFKTLKEGLAIFTDGYNQEHNRGYVGSMSACINWLFFRPAIVEIENIDQIMKWVINPLKAQKITVRNISGSYTGIDLNSDVVNSIWTNAPKPELITDEVSL